MADRADFAPELGALKSLRPFVFWAQTTLPTVFDDSLSYYEVLTKLTKMVNTMLENEDTNAENIAALAEAYQELEDFTNNYFENLDVTQEINDKLDGLVADGTIGGYVVDRATTLVNNYLYGEDGESGKNKEIEDMISEAQTDIETALDNFATRSNLAVTTFETNSAASIRTFENRVDDELAGVSTIVEDWMDANFTNPSSVVIDDTLTVKDAAAEAYATGKLMDDATNMVLATSYWQDYVVDSVSGSFILADVSGGSNPAVGTGAPSKTLYIANVTPGETYIVSGVASSYSTTRYTPAYALGNLTYDASDNPYYEFYDVYPRGWDESQDPGTVYQYVRNQTVRIPTGTTPAVTHLFIVGDSRVPITVRCSRLNARTDTALTSETLPAQGKATGDALETKLPWPVSGGNKDLGTAGYGLVTNADGTTSWQEVGGDYDEEIENLQNDVVDLKSAITPVYNLPIDGNYYNTETDLVNKDINSSTGAIVNASGYCVSDKIVMPDYTLRVRVLGSTYKYIYCYDAADAYLGRYDTSNTDAAPATRFPTTAYFRFVRKTTDTNVSVMYHLYASSIYVPFRPVGGWNGSETKIRLVTYNTGNFTGIDLPRNSVESINAYREVIQSFEADMIFYQYDTGNVNSISAFDNILSRFLPYGKLENHGDYNFCAYRGLFPYLDTGWISYSGLTGNTHNGFQYVDFPINGDVLRVINVHFDWKDNTMRTSEIEQVITATADFKNCIVLGDFNPEDYIDGVKQSSNLTYASDNQYFVDAGFTPLNANDNLLGIINTIAETGAQKGPWDNIMIKGNIKIASIGTFSRDWMNDHYPFYADITLR